MERTSKISGKIFIGGGVIKNQTSGFTFRGRGVMTVALTYLSLVIRVYFSGGGGVRSGWRLGLSVMQ